MKNDAYQLERFLKAQNRVYETVLRELKEGRKCGHWMWFIFPQVSGLGISTKTKLYEINSKEEAIAFLNHPVLGQRLIECVEILLGIEGKTAREIFSSPDDRKLKSSMTLFAEISEPGSVFEKVLVKYYQGSHCSQTKSFLAGRDNG